MPTVLIDRPVGDPTRASDNNAKNDAIAELQASIGAATSAGLPNASFELDNDSDGEPDGWEATNNSGGSHSIDTSERIGGTNAMEFVTTVGGGWVEMITNQFLKGGNVGGMLSGWFKIDTTSVRIRVQVLEYDVGFSLTNTITFIDETPTEIDEWFMLSEGRYPVEGPYYKVKIIVGESGGSVGATVLLDQIEFNPKNTLSTIVNSYETTSGNVVEDYTVGYVYLTPAMSTVDMVIWVDINDPVDWFRIVIDGTEVHTVTVDTEGLEPARTTNTVVAAGWKEVIFRHSGDAAGSITSRSYETGVTVF